MVTQIEWQFCNADSEYVTKQAGGTEATSESQSTKSTLENSQVYRNRGWQFR